jgi:hypothetical protein
MLRAGILALVGSVIVPGVLVFIWFVALLTGFTLYGFVHLLLVLAILLFPFIAIAGIVLVIVGSQKT